MLPTRECSSRTWVQALGEHTQTVVLGPANPEQGCRTGTEDIVAQCTLVILHWLVPQEFAAASFCLIAFDDFFFFHLIIFYLLMGGLGAVPRRYSKEKWPVGGWHWRGWAAPDQLLGELGALRRHVQQEEPPSHCPTVEVPAVGTANDAHAREEAPHTKQVSWWEVQELLCRCLLRAQWGELVRRGLHCLLRVRLLGPTRCCACRRLLSLSMLLLQDLSFPLSGLGM